MTTDLRDQIDHSFGEGPAHRDDLAVLFAGRRAVRRRRIAAGAGAALVVAVVAGGALATGVPAGTSGQQEPMTIPTVTSAPEQAAYQHVPASDPALDGQDVLLAPDGTLYVRQGLEVLELVADPMEAEPPRHSVALATAAGGDETWWLLESGPRSSSASSEAARQSFPDLAMWVDDQVAMQRGEPTLALVRFGPDGTLVPDQDGVEILEQRPDVDLGPSFAGPDDPTAVAAVQWRGERWYVLARHLQGSGPAWSCGGGCPAEYFPTAASVSRPTLDGFLEHARASYDEGTGLR